MKFCDAAELQWGMWKISFFSEIIVFLDYQLFNDLIVQGDFLPVIEADNLNLGVRPHRIKRINEPVKVCLVVNQVNFVVRLSLQGCAIVRSLESPHSQSHFSSEADEMSVCLIYFLYFGWPKWSWIFCALLFFRSRIGAPSCLHLWRHYYPRRGKWFLVTSR